MNKTLVFDSKIVQMEQTSNPLLSRIKIRIAYWGRNRNNSNISKDAFIDALPSIYNCPIVGEYLVKNNDFGGHGGKLANTPNGLEIVPTTIPYGVINDKTEISWEVLPDENGVDREYLCATGFIWTGRFKELENVVEDSKGQSMEIEILESEFIDIDGEQVEDITKFIFSGFCILGDDVEPCFEDANIAAFSLDEAKEYFRKEFRKMVYELKDHLEEEFRQLESDKNKEEKEGVGGLKNKNFSFTSEQLEDELRIALSKVKINDYGWEYNRYCFEDYMPDKNVVLAWDYDNSYVVGMSYSVDSDAVSIDLSTVKRYKAGEWAEMDLPVVASSNNTSIVTNFAQIIKIKDEQIVEFAKVTESISEYKKQVQDLQENFNASNAAFTALKDNYSELESKYSLAVQESEGVKTELATFMAEKEKADEDALFANFVDQFTDEEIESAKESMKEMSLEQKEEKLFALLGKKNSKFSKNGNAGGLLGVKVFNKNNTADPYGGLLSEDK